MSLAVLADHMASKGRGPDSMLIHMSPREVQGLQALAMKNGGSLTINPETGLPEAGFLDKLLPAIIGFALAPMTAGTSLAFLGATPMASALTVGGLQTLRTGDIGKGIQAGLGAYGGASLGANLASAGTGAISSEVGGEALKAAGLTGEAALTAEADQVVQRAVGEKLAAATPYETLSAGADVVKNNPMKYLKANAMPLASAFGPAILAGESAESNMPKTTTGMIAPYTFDPYSGSYTAANRYPASPNRAAGGGLMGMAAGGIAGYGDGDDVPRQNGMAQGGMYDFAQRSEPVVRMARGGIAGYAGNEGSLVGGGSRDTFEYNGDTFYSDSGTPVNYFDQQFAPVATAPAATDNALAAYQAGNYGEASRLLGEAGMGAQDVVNKYGLSQADAATVAQNLGYAGDMSGIQYAAPAANTGYQSVNDLYQGVLGRGVESEGAAGYWQNQFGPTIDANEVAQFQQAAQPELAGRNASTTGGLNALAATPAFSNQYTFANINDYIANNNLDAAGIAAAAKQFNVDPAQVTAAQNAQSVVSNVFRNVLGRDPDPNGLDYWTNQIMTGKSTGQEMLNTFIQNAKANNEIIVNPNIKLDDAVKEFGGYKSSNARDIADEWVRNTLGREVTASDRQQQWYKDAVNDAVMNTYGKAQDIYGGFKTYAQGEATATTAKAINDARASLAARGLTEADVIKQTGKTIAQLVAGGTNLGLDLYQASQLKAPGAATKFDFSTITKAKTVPPVVTPPITYNTAGTNVPGGLESILGLPPGVSGAGITTVNPNGTITTRPDLTLPMSQVRDDYVRGGGSLGYTSPTFASLKAVEDKYPLRGGSKQSYDFLTGKTDYDPVPYTKTGELMKPYASSVLGIPMASAKQMYLFDPATKTYKINPDYAIPTYDKDGKKSLNLTNQDVINYVKSPEYSNDDAFVSWMTSNNLTPEQVAAATGMSIADVYKKIKKAKPVDAVVAAPVTGQNDGGGGGEANGGLMSMARGGMAQQFNLGDYSDGGRLLRGPGDGVSDSIPASIGGKRPARLADGEFVVPARIVSELGNGSTEAGARKLYAMMDRIQSARRSTVGKGRVAKNSRAEKYLPA